MKRQKDTAYGIKRRTRIQECQSRYYSEDFSRLQPHAYSG